MCRYEDLKRQLLAAPETWLVTGAAGFIGSHLVHALLELEQRVIGLDDFSTGSKANLEDVQRTTTPERWARFTLVQADIRDSRACNEACVGVDRVLHQAALGSVPRSIEQPQRTHSVNVDGFVNMALAAVEASVPFVYASSSSVYGDHPRLPKVEEQIGKPLSPYAASKRVDEVYAEAFHATYDLRAVGLRYFNVVGPRQDPSGAYAAVVPKWLSAFKAGGRPHINGDGQTSRDFCPVQNVVQANILAAFAPDEAVGGAFNVGLGGRTTLNELYKLLCEGMCARGAPCEGVTPEYRDFRKGDVRHSHADISKASRLLGYRPAVTLEACLASTMDWFAEHGH